MAEQPTSYGNTQFKPRGDYQSANPNYECVQHWERYTANEHALFAKLWLQQRSTLAHKACAEFIAGLSTIEKALGDNLVHIPRFETINQALYHATRWQIVGVPGLIPETDFFNLLAERKFPVSVWLRTPEEAEYIVEPDLFHDLFGHVPLLFNPIFADYMQAYGKGGQKADSAHCCEYLARLYWYTVEFGLLNTSQGLRVYGAGILSSHSELAYSVADPHPQRVAFNLQRIMRTQYNIDRFQDIYFVIESYQQLFDATAPDFLPIYESLAQQPTLHTTCILPGEMHYSANSVAYD